MVSMNQIEAGVSRWLDRELMPKLPTGGAYDGLKKAATVALALYAIKRGRAALDGLTHNSFLATIGAVDHEGNIDIEGGGGALYDAEIEYLESTGTQWIDTGIRITSSCKIELSVIGKNTTDTSMFGTNNGSAYDKGEAAVTSKENVFIIIYPINFLQKNFFY
jgi:hypothetical protein